MADEANVPNHRYYQPRNNIKLQPNEMSKAVIKASGIAKIDAHIIRTPLFSAGEQGVWYDPSDLTTLFQDSAGTTPVTATGQTVGKILDKSGRGNHATQATTASRPTYGINPITGRRNLLTRTEEFDNAVWVKNLALTVPATQYLAPNGTTTAESLVFTGYANDSVQQDITGLPPVLGVTFTFSLWLRCASGTTTIRFGITQPTVIDYNTVLTVTTDWQRFTITQAFGSVGTSARVRILNNASGTSGTVFAWGAQLELGSTATAYQRVTDQYNVTEAGVASAHYLRFDGTDDSMVTNTITPAIDKAQVFAGVRKLSDAAAAVVAEMGTTGTQNGVFTLTAPLSGANYYFNSRGTGDGQAISATSFSAPITNVLTGLGDISGDRSTLRVNGTQAAQSTADQGTGDYLAYPLYIGRRGGTTLPFNGQIYSMIVRFGANLTTGQITSTETYVAGKTGVTL